MTGAAGDGGVDEINVDEPPERRGEAVKTPRQRQAEHEVFIGTPEQGSESRSSRLRQVQAQLEVQGVFSVPVGRPLINAPWISTQGGTTYGVAPEVWRQMQQQYVHQQPVRLQPDPLMMFLQQQSQQNAFMMQQMMQMTTAGIERSWRGERGCAGGPSGGPPAGVNSFGGISSSSPGGGAGSSTSFPAEGKMPFNVNLPVCAWREWNTKYKELVGFRQWLDQFSHWLNLIDTRFPGSWRLYFA